MLETVDRISILGSPVSVVDSYRKVYDIIVKKLQSDNSPFYITVNNVHTVVTAVKDNHYNKIIRNSFLALPDGKPLTVVAKLKGVKNISRIFGPTFFEKSIDWSQKDGIKHFFFGGDKITQEKILRKISESFPACNVAGNIIPPFRKFTEEENNKFLKVINNSAPDFIWVALGAPKQEKWIYENYSKLNKGVMIGIGAGFDYFAGNLKHAPHWMKNFSLEWLYRLIQEPKRLWKRYLITNSLFLWYIALDFLRLRKFD